MNKTHPEVDAFFRKPRQWQEELLALRKILLDSPLSEEFKWGKPCYTCGKTNLIILQGFKPHCAMLFTNGALLKDPAGILQKPGENTQAARRVTFTEMAQILRLQDTLKAYIQQAIDAENAGLKATFKTSTDYAVPDEFQLQLDKNPALKKAFVELTPGRQRAYLMHFSSAKQSQTRSARVEKCLPQILAGKGMND